MDTVTYREILSRLTPDAAGVSLQVFDSVTSTNDLLREAAERNAPEFTVFAAKQQTAGKGRQGRQFYSPPQTGLYLSILFRPQIAPADTLALTPMAAVAAADAVERCTGFPPEIRDIAGAVYPAEANAEDAFTDCAAALISALMREYRGLPQKHYLAGYRSRLCMLGKTVTVCENGTERQAQAIAVDDDLRLLVRYADGTEQWRSTGEIRIRL